MPSSVEHLILPWIAIRGLRQRYESDRALLIETCRGLVDSERSKVEALIKEAFDSPRRSTLVANAIDVELLNAESTLTRFFHYNLFLLAFLHVEHCLQAMCLHEEPDHNKLEAATRGNGPQVMKYQQFLTKHGLKGGWNLPNKPDDKKGSWDIIAEEYVEIRNWIVHHNRPLDEGTRAERVQNAMARRVERGAKGITLDTQSCFLEMDRAFLTEVFDTIEAFYQNVLHDIATSRTSHRRPGRNID